MTATVIQLQSSLNVAAPIASVGKEAAFIQSYQPYYMWRFGSKVSPNANNGFRDLIRGKKLIVLKDKPLPSLSENYISFSGNTALVTENTTDEISSAESLTIACAVRMNTAPTLASGIVSNHKRCEFGVSSGTSGYKGITTGTTQLNDISFMVASVNSRVTDDDAQNRANGSFHTFIGVYNKDVNVAANNTAKLYIDGNLIATVTLDPSNPSIGNAAAYPEDSMLAKRLLIGALLTANGNLATAYNFFIGDLANVAVFTQALNATACAAYHNYVFEYL